MLCRRAALAANIWTSFNCVGLSGAKSSMRGSPQARYSSTRQSTTALRIEALSWLNNLINAGTSRGSNTCN